MTSTIGPIPTLQDRSMQRFGVVVRGFAAFDAVMLLFLTFGYITKSHATVGFETAAFAADSASPVGDALKASPFRVPVRERVSGRQPDVVYKVGQAVATPEDRQSSVGYMQSASPSAPSSTVVPVTTAVAWPLGVN